MTKHAIGISNEKLENSSHKKITTGRLRDFGVRQDCLDQQESRGASSFALK